MCKKLAFLVCVIVVLGLSGNAFAEDPGEADLLVADGETHTVEVGQDVTLDGGFYVQGTLIIKGTLTCEGDGYRPTINGDIEGNNEGIVIVDGGNLNLPVRMNMGQKVDDEEGTVGNAILYIINDGNVVQWEDGGEESGDGIKFPDDGDGESRIYVLDGELIACSIEYKEEDDAEFSVGCNGTITVGDTDDGDEYDPVAWLVNGDLNCDAGCPGIIVITDLGGDVKEVICLLMAVATDPKPGNGATGVCPNDLVLSWTPTDLITDPNHDFYFGTDYNDVRDANRTNHPAGVAFSENQDPNKYPPVGDLDLELMTTYYWKVYEVNDPCVWETPVIWSFTTEDGNASDLDPPDGRRGVNPSSPLTWTPSCLATAQDVYLSTDFNDVNEMEPGAKTTVSGTDNNLAPALAKFTNYYWRIDTTGGGTTEVQGFKTGYGGLLLEMLFDGGTPGNDLPATVTDTSGNNLVFTKYVGDGGSVKYGDGFGTSVDVSANAGLYRPDPCGTNDPPDLLRLDGYQYTIQFWTYLPAEAYTEKGAFMMVGKQNGWRITINDPTDNDDIRWYHNGGEETRAEGILPELLDEWSHVCAVYDQSLPDSDDSEKKLYINGELKETDGVNGLNASDNNTPVGIGVGVQNPPPFSFDWYFEGKIDELRIWDIALDPTFQVASKPFPPDRSRGWDPNDPNLDKFMWKPGADVNSLAGHKIYFGTSLDDVNESAEPYVTLDSNSWTHSETFTIAKTYYWRVDEVNGSDVWPGPIWKFQTEVEFIDASLVVYYPFDEASGKDVPDYSGNYFEGKADGGSPFPYPGMSVWEPDNGRFDGCINFNVWLDPDSEDDMDAKPGTVELDDGDEIDELLGLINKKISISVWLNADPNQWPHGDEDEDENVVFEICDDGLDAPWSENTQDFKICVVAPDESGDLIFRAGNGYQTSGGDVLRWTDFDADSIKGAWKHFVFIKNENDANMYIYLNTELVATKTDCNTTSLSKVLTGDTELSIGSYVDNDKGYDGRMDDFQIYNKQLNEQEIKEIFRGGELGPAWAPDPYDGESGVSCKVVLEWKPGNYASLHQVYFGTSWQDVNSMTDPCATKDLGDENYDPCGLLELEQTYYWRVDEVNEANDDTWKGKVWKFTVAEYIGIDDMEDYTEGSANPIDGDNGWTQGWETVPATGSIIGLGLPSYGVPVRDKQSMVYYYDNTDSFYSETGTKSLDPRNWTYADVKMLTLWFHGENDPQNNDANETEQLYVGLEDGDGNYAEVRYPMEDMDNIRLLDWTEWNIALSDFNDDNPNLNLTDVNTLYIGFGDRNGSENGGGGTVYFDDIRLYPPTCVPSQRPEAFAKIDFNNDCIVDFGDVEIMAEEWLKSDVNLGEVSEPCDANLVGWWMLDEGSESTAYDSSDYGNDGTIEVIDVNVSWVAGRNDVNCALEFDGGRVRVSDAAELRPEHQVSVSAWINYSEEQDNGRIVVKGADNKETYDLEVGGNDELVFSVRDGNDYDAEDDDKYKQYAAESDDDALDRDEWIHIAGTYDGNSVKCYINGEVAATNNDANAITYAGNWLSQDTNDLAIGNRSDAMDKPFKGIIDDVRVYNYGLSAAEVAYIATDGGHNGIGIFRMQSVANPYSEEPLGSGVVNLKDFAKLSEAWLEEKLWPEPE